MAWLRPGLSGGGGTLGLTLALLAGRPDAAPTRPSFPAAAELVQVDVVVLDDQGRPVRGLRPEDFTVRDDGQPQVITAFEAVTEGDEAAEAPGSSPDARPPAAGGRATAPRRTELVVVFDELHLSPGGLNQVRRRLADAFEEEAPGTTDVTLLSSAGGGAWRGRLPDERESLVAALGRFEGRRRAPQPGRLSDQEAFQIAARHDDRVLTEVYRRYLDQRLLPDPTVPGMQPRMRGQQTEAQANLPAMGRVTVQVEAEMLWRDIRGRQVAALRALVNLLDGLAVRPGRKAVLLLSEGFLYDQTLVEHRELLAAARRAQAGVHLVDPRSANRIFWHDGDVPDWVDSRDSAQALDRALKESEGAEAVAAGTGGQVLRHLPALPQTLARIRRELGSYYLLGYAPSGPLDDGRYHALTIEVARPGLRLHARPGYYALAPRSVVDGRGVEAGLEGLLVAPAAASTLPLEVAALVLGPAGKGRTLVRLVAEVGTGGLAPDAAAVGAQGLLQLVARDRGPTQRWTGRAVRSGDGQGQLRLEAQFTVTPGVYQAQAVLALADGVTSGSARQTVVVLPDVAFRLSTPILTDRLDGSRPVARAARVFRSDGSLHCLVEVLGSSIVGPVSAGLQLLGADGRVWRDLRPAPLVSARRSRMWTLPLSELPPGSYSLSISVQDEGARQGLQQREPFEIVSPAGS